MEPAIGTRTWYGVRRWGCHYLTRWFRCPPGVDAGLEAGGVSVTPLAPLLVSIHSISSVTGCSGSHALVHLVQRSCEDSLAVINHLYFGKHDTCLTLEEHCDRSLATPCWCPRELIWGGVFPGAGAGACRGPRAWKLQTVSPHAGAGACRGLNMPQMSSGLRSHSCHQAPRQLAGGQSGGY